MGPGFPSLLMLLLGAPSFGLFSEFPYFKCTSLVLSILTWVSGSEHGYITAITSFGSQQPHLGLVVVATFISRYSMIFHDSKTRVTFLPCCRYTLRSDGTGHRAQGRAPMHIRTILHHQLHYLELTWLLELHLFKISSVDQGKQF
ncbi:hypothetical protein K469DRAFT_47918 [Zopfia rhizophila CBS 207.26]|uniref:Uncharacterized protein n=1 Tax=Zopfia rhizophila CBS 207.26 TaxID=1314779 RepID=A0A6A6EDG8_9PEZI|nr:hypothetical protein K469DRAFT_47918 [Zopfia rhizophila CBS 207.26]